MLDPCSLHFDDAGAQLMPASASASAQSVKFVVTSSPKRAKPYTAKAVEIEQKTEKVYFVDCGSSLSPCDRVHCTVLQYLMTVLYH